MRLVEWVVPIEAVDGYRVCDLNLDTLGGRNGDRRLGDGADSCALAFKLRNFVLVIDVVEGDLSELSSLNPRNDPNPSS